VPGRAQRPAEPGDPVEQLKTALRLLKDIPPGEEALAFRKSILEKHVGQLRSVADLARALTLLAPVDRDIREEIVRRLHKEARAALQGDDTGRQRATLVLLGEMAVNARNKRYASDPRELARLADEVARLTRSKEPSVAAAAASTLAKLEADLDVVVPALKQLLRSGDVSARRAAAGALREMVQDPGQLRTGDVVGRDDVYRVLMTVAKEVVPAAGSGVADEKAEVRRLCLEAIRDAARLAQDAIRIPYKPEDFPLPGRPLSEFEEKLVKRATEEIKNTDARLRPLLPAFTRQVPAIIKSLSDADPLTGLAAAEALEAVGEVRQKLRRLFASVPPYEPGAPPFAVDPRLGEALREAVPDLAKQVSGKKEVRLRLACLYALESLADAAAPATPALVEALKDDNAYVRWGAVRVLGRVAPAEAERAVPGLAPLLKDKNEYVRATTALVLTRYGPAAKAAVPALDEAAKTGEARFRILAVRALEAIGPDAAPAVATLAAALTADEPEVRVAAARALGKLGKLAAKAAPALEKALDDPDAEVRLAASEALLLLR
jgi:HEAT repeat protein